MAAVTSFYQDLVNALVKIEAGDQSIEHEILALQQAQANFEAQINTQITNSVATAIQQAGLDPAAVKALQDQVAALQAQVNGDEAAATAADGTLAPPPPAALVVTPNPADITAGVADTVALTFSGGTAPFTASGLPAGVTFDGSNLVGDDTTVASTTEVTFTDSSATPLTASTSVVIA